MPDLNEVPISNLTEYMQFVEEQEVTTWYRGCGDSEYRLIPALYRHTLVEPSQELCKFENDMLELFIQRSMPYTNSSLSLEKEMETLFLMQHYGVPTRLLDWTENP